VAGIDPASTTGMVCLLVDPERPADRATWRWVDGVVIRPTGRAALTGAENKLALYDRCRAQLLSWGVVSVAIERPADALRGWNAQGQRGQQTGTAFAIGECYGMIAAAAWAAGCHVQDYAVSARAANEAKRQRERVGWMPRVTTGRLSHTQGREVTLAQLHALSVELRQRPANGVLPGRAPAVLDENIRMALGVVQFHLTRHPPLVPRVG
jgi:hypothetical protein